MFFILMCRKPRRECGIRRIWDGERLQVIFMYFYWEAMGGEGFWRTTSFRSFTAGVSEYWPFFTMIFCLAKVRLQRAMSNFAGVHSIRWAQSSVISRVVSPLIGVVTPVIYLFLRPFISIYRVYIPNLHLVTGPHLVVIWSELVTCWQVCQAISTHPHWVRETKRMGKNLKLTTRYIGDETLPSFVGIFFINRYKDFHETTSIMEK